jgi:hypothetical protein
VDLEGRAGELLASARIGMLALGAGRLPLVNPAAFSFSGGSVWMTTSRHAAKLALARRDRRAAFLVEGEGRAVVLQGMLETFDPLSPGGAFRAARAGPGFALSLAGYAMKNAPYVGGYLLDLARIPADWWPQNRVVLRLVAERARQLRTDQVPPTPRAPRTLPGVPAEVARPLAHSALGYLCWQTLRGPSLAPVAWDLDGDDALLRLPPSVGSGPPDGAAGALVVERHHSYRATRMLGVCLRGRLSEEPAGELRLETERVTWWQGFRVRTRRLRSDRPVEAPA